MKRVGVFLALAEIDCCSDSGREQLWQAIRYFRALRLARDPCRAVPVELEKLLVLRLADFQVRRAIGLLVDVLRDHGRIAATVLLAGRARLIKVAALPAAMVAAPCDALLVDGDSEAFQLLVCRPALQRASRTCRVISTGPREFRRDPGAAQNIGGAGHEPLPPQLSLLGAGTLTLAHSCKMEKKPVTFSTI